MAKTVYYAQSEAPITAVPSDLIIWGPGDPRPTLPIAGWDPGSGTWPKPPPSNPPDGIWGPNPGFPTNPIAEPPWGWGNPPPVPDVPAAPGWKPMYGYLPEPVGWFVFAIPTGPVPTPSK